MKEAHPWGEKSHHGRRLMDECRKSGCRPRLVVVFEKTGQSVLELQPRQQMLAHRPGLSGAQPVVQTLVVSVVEPLLLQGPLQVPVDFREDQKFRMAPTDASNDLGPEGVCA